MTAKKNKLGTPRAKGTALETPPTFNACRPVIHSDGISEWPVYEFDTTIPWTADDTAAWEKSCDESSPRGLILGMQAQLAALEPITDPYIQVQVDVIREIHARLKRLTEIPPQMTVDEWMYLAEHDRAKFKQLQAMGEFSEEDERLLLKADEAWRKIVVLRDLLPAAIKGKKFPPGKPKGAYGPMKKFLQKLIKKLAAGERKYSIEKMSARGLWNMCKELPMRDRDGWTFGDNDQATHESGDQVGFGRFETSISELGGLSSLGGSRRWSR